MIARCSLQTTAAERAIGAVGRLPPFSPIMSKLVSTLNDEEVSVAEIADIVEKDTVLSGNVLRLVNSAAYARSGTVNSVRRAVSLLGINKLRNVAIGISLNKLWNGRKLPAGWSSSKYNLHGVACAILADLLAAELPVEYPEGAFVAGLLQNIGMLLVAVGCEQEFEQIRIVYQGGTLPLIECEREVLQSTHPELSAHTLRHWKLPQPIITAVAEHHGPHPNSPHGVTLGYVIAVADRLAAQRGILVQDWVRPSAEPVGEILAPVGLGEKSEAILTSFESEFETLTSFFQ
jgi:HD-like signal output (HDOD) protein